MLALSALLGAAGAAATPSAGAPPQQGQWQQLSTSSDQQQQQQQQPAGPDEVVDNRQLVWLTQPAGDTEAAGCLDGSPYAFYIWPGNSSEWSVFINGGGWCLTEELCETRAATALGSSLGYNLSGAFGPPPGNKNGGPPAYTCQGLDPNCTRVFMPYCDGSCFTSQRAAHWPVKNSNSSLQFRGLANLDRTMDVLEARFGLASARRLVLQGGSAGGLSTYLHLDRVTERLKRAQQRAAAARGDTQATTDVPAGADAVSDVEAGSSGDGGRIQVVGRPVAGFFIDEKKFDPTAPTYAENIQYGVEMFNSTPPLSSACKAKYPGDEWKCWMATYASPYVREPVFAVQSRFDEFQLMCLLGAHAWTQGFSVTPELVFLGPKLFCFVHKIV